MQNWFAICGIFLLVLVMVHGTSYQQILWCEFKTLGFTFAHGFIKFPK